MEYEPSPLPSPSGRGSEEKEQEQENQQKYKNNSYPPLPLGEGLGVRAEIAKLAGSNRHIPDVLLERARELRKQQTSAEKILWECLRNRRLLNKKFRRQHNIDRYIVDFYCHEKSLIIEVDGSIHASQQTEDYIREKLVAISSIYCYSF